MESHPDRDDDLADVVDELEENVSEEHPHSPEPQEPPPTEDSQQEPPD